VIIGLSGYAKSGKDTVAGIIQKYEPSFEIKKFSGKLKLIASILTGIPAEEFEKQDVKDGYLSGIWNRDIIEFAGENMWVTPGADPYPVRNFLQELGTDAIRDCIHPNAWVNALMCDYKAINTARGTNEFDVEDIDIEPNWLVTDVRFPNEADAIRKAGGIILRIKRTGVGPANAHPSEIALDEYEFDGHIFNVSTVEFLELTVLEKVIDKYIRHAA
jgi:hypothetical protein